jgi:hypothetical protein
MCRRIPFVPKVLLGLSVLSLSMVEPPTMQLPTESTAFRRAQLASAKIKPAEKLSRYTRYDFGPLWTQTSNAAVVGFIGPNCQRLRVKILTVRRDTADLMRYYLTGKTQVAGYVSAFSGTLVLRQVRELRQLKPLTEAALETAINAFRSAQREGFALADYELRESPGQPKSGVFRGVTRTNWFLNKRGQLRYDELYGAGDGYCNNQFVGTWTSYATKKALRCNWGDYRIPNSGDFDIGAGEFSPADKYLAFGWQELREADMQGNEAARRREARTSQTWWK